MPEVLFFIVNLKTTRRQTSRQHGGVKIGRLQLSGQNIFLPATIWIQHWLIGHGQAHDIDLVRPKTLRPRQRRFAADVPKRFARRCVLPAHTAATGLKEPAA